MNEPFYAAFKYVMGAAESITDANIELVGVENVPKDTPCLFISNHFTRMETFILPYFLYKKLGYKVRAVAHDTLFVSYLGTLLSELGVISTKHEMRNRIILGDMLSGQNHWLIFPEGRMVKTKRVMERHGHYFTKVEDDIIRKVHTGMGVFALESQLLREEYFQANPMVQEHMRRHYFLQNAEVLTESTKVLPVSISYLPIHPNENIIAKTARQLVGDLAPRIMEELKVEGELLLHSRMVITIGKPIDTCDYLKSSREETLACGRQELTFDTMHQVYENITFSADHLFAFILEHFPKDRIALKHLKALLFLLLDVMSEKSHYRIDKQHYVERVKLISDREYEPFIKSLELAKEQKVITEEDEMIYLDREMFHTVSDFHQIRLSNTFKVLGNEMKLYPKLYQLFFPHLNMSASEVYYENFERLRKKAVEMYRDERAKFREAEELKDDAVGRPFFLDGCEGDVCKDNIGVVLSHGFGSSPGEVRELAYFLKNHGIHVYGLRLQGHGTAPEALKETAWQAWQESFEEAYALMQMRCEKVFLAGFSTGGLLALLSASKKLSQGKIAGVICINGALKLNDVRMNYLLPAVSMWNDFVSHLHGENLQMEKIENIPAYSDTNYHTHYVRSIRALSELMQATHKALPSINAPTLTIQGTHDPVVNPKGAVTIMEEIDSAYKLLIYLDFDRHVIIRGEGKELLFNEVLSFIYNNRRIWHWEKSRQLAPLQPSS